MRLWLISLLLVSLLATSLYLTRNKGERVVLSVPGMHCSMCAKSIQHRLEKFASVDGASFDFASKTITIHLQRAGTLDDGTIKAAIEKLNYFITDIRRTPDA